MIRPVRPDAIRHIIDNMRENDWKELVEGAHIPIDSPHEIMRSWMINYFSTLGGIGYIWEEDGEPIVAGGVTSFWPGTGQAWMFATDKITDAPLGVTKACKRIVHDTLAGPLQRVQAYSAVFHDESHQWLELLGFQREGVMRQLGQSGADFYLYSIVRN